MAGPSWMNEGQDDVSYVPSGSNPNSGGSYNAGYTNTSNGYAPVVDFSPYIPQNNTQVKDNSAQINQMYDQQKSKAIAELKQAISQNKSKYQSTIQNAPTQYQPLRNQVSANKYKNLNSLREMMANQGQRGGVNRTETTRVNAAAESDINTLNAQQQQIIDDANRAITDLETSGSFQEAQLVAQNAAEKIQALMNESNRVEQTSYQRLRDSISDAKYDKEFEYETYQDALRNALAQRQFDTSVSQWDKTFDYNVGQDAIANNLARIKASSGSSPSISELNYNDEMAARSATSQAMDYLNLYASGKAKDDEGNSLGRATRSDIIDWINRHSGELYNQGIDVTELRKWADATFRWDKDSSGEWKQKLDI